MGLEPTTTRLRAERSEPTELRENLPSVGLEPTTTRLKAERSKPTELRRRLYIRLRYLFKPFGGCCNSKAELTPAPPRALHQEAW